MTLIPELLACLERLIAGDFVCLDTPVWLLSRDGEQLRPIDQITVREPARFRKRGQKEQLRSVSLLCHGLPAGDHTQSVGELLHYLEYAAATAERGGWELGRVRLLADGFGAAHWAELDSIKLAAEIPALDLTETILIFTT